MGQRDSNLTISEYLERYAGNYDKIERIVTAIYPYNIVEPLFRKKAIESEIRAGAEKIGTGGLSDGERLKLLDELGAAALVEDEEHRARYAALMASCKFIGTTSYISDMASGLLTLATRELQSEVVEWILTYPFSTYFFVDYKGLLKATFGSAVDGNGRAIHGFGDIVREGKKLIEGVLRHQILPPVIFSRTPHYDKKHNLIGFKTIAGKPIDIKATLFNRDGTIDKVAIELSHDFFPISCYTTDGQRFERIIDRQRYIHTVAGLHSILSKGRNEFMKTASANGQVPSVITAKQIIMAEQAAYSMKSIIPELAQERKSGRTDVVLRAQFIKHNLTHNVRSNGTLDWKGASENVAAIGKFYINGLKSAGIFEEIVGNDRIIIPATDKACQFERDRPNIVYVKLDKPGGW